jgi:hypothetical protein
VYLGMTIALGVSEARGVLARMKLNRKPRD